MRAILVIAGLCYPFLVMFGLAHVSTRWIGVTLAVFVAARWSVWRRASHTRGRGLLIGGFAAVGSLCLAAALLDEARYLEILPTAISWTLAATFGASLASRTSLVETFARLHVEDLSADELAYCRRVTWVWTVFLALNGAVIAWLALRASREMWALYSGFIGYLLMGALFAVEFVYRHYRFRRYLGWPTDVVLKRLFPPREAR